MARRSEHHSLHPDPRQHPPKEESILRPRAFHLRSGTHSLYLSRWPVTQLWGRVYRNRAFNYIGTRKKCGPCFLPDRNAPVPPFGAWIIHQNEPARQRAREPSNTPEFTKAQRQRKKVEALFAELKNQDRIAALAFTGDSGPCASSSSWQLSPRTSSDSFASSVSRHHRFCWPPLSRTETREPATACAHMKGVLFRDFFQHPRLFSTIMTIYSSQAEFWPCWQTGGCWTLGLCDGEADSYGNDTFQSLRGCVS